MEKKPSLILSDEFIKFCEINKINDVLKVANETFERGFTILKYGETPQIIIPKTPLKSTINEDEKINNKKDEKDFDIYGQ